MTKRRPVLRRREGKWTAIPGLAALAIGAVLLSAYSGASSSQGARNRPVQPIAFSHPVHVQKLGMNCLYCHYTANKSPDPGLPALSTCMGCHTVVTSQTPQVKKDIPELAPEIDKLAKYYNGGAGKPVPWIRIHKVPRYVHFPHMRHVNAGVTCQTCHGQVQKMDRVYQYSSLNMGWCVSCHVNGYSPKEGLEAAGYAWSDAAAPTVQPAGEPLPGQATQAPPPPTQGAPGEPAGAVPSPAGAGPTAYGPPAAGASSWPGTTYPRAATDGRRRARYDCAVCHY